MLRGSGGGLALATFLCLLLAATSVAQSPPGTVPLNTWSAAQAGDIAALKKLLDAGKNLNEFHPTYSFSPLEAAISAYRADAVSWLVRHGAHIGAQNPKSGATPLHAAAFVGDVASARVLIKAGSDPFASDSDGLTVFRITDLDWPTTANVADMLQLTLDYERVVRGRNEIRNLMRASLAKRAETDLRAALFLGNAKAVSKLLRNGADPDQPIDSERTTPLVFATIFNHKRIVKALLAAGANVDAPSGTLGATALHAAMFAGRADAARMLLDAGADPSVSDRSGSVPKNTALMDWPTTAFLAAAIGVKLEHERLSAGRTKIYMWLQELESTTTPESE